VSPGVIALSSHATLIRARDIGAGFASKGTTSNILTAMSSGAWPAQASFMDYSSPGSLRWLPNFPYHSSPIWHPIATEYQTYTDLPANFGNPRDFNCGTAYRGLEPSFQMPPYSVGTVYQTCLGPNTTPYATANDYQNPTMHCQYYSRNQVPAFHGLPPFATLPSYQQAVSYQVGTDSIRQNPINFGQIYQPCHATIDWGDSRAISMEIKKLKDAWREGVGIKKKYKGSKNQGCCESNQMHGASKQKLERPVFNDAGFRIKSEEMPCDSGKEYGDNFGRKSTINSNSSTIPLSFNGSNDTDKLDDGMTTLEEFEKLELLPSPKETPTHKMATTKTNFDHSPVNLANEEFHLLELSSGYNTVRQPASGPLAFEELELKCKSSSAVLSKGAACFRPTTPGLSTFETNAMKGKKSSRSRCNGVASLRPPKPIAKSSKPVTQPVPFNLVGETVARKLKLKGEKRRQSIRGMA
jgi:hypothetical protein